MSQIIHILLHSMNFHHSFLYVRIQLSSQDSGVHSSYRVVPTHCYSVLDLNIMILIIIIFSFQLSQLRLCQLGS